MNNKGLKGDIIMSENKNINETEEKIISLDEFLNVCIKFLNSEITKEDLKEWLDNNLYIKRYLPLQTKCAIITHILLEDNFLGIDNNIIIAYQIELKKFYRILLSYTNIDVSECEDLMTMENYDIIMMCVGNVLYSLIGEDYNRTVDLLNNTINVSNIQNIMDTISISGNNQTKMSSELKKTFKVFDENKETVNKILDIIKINNQKITDEKINKINEI